MDQSIKSRVSKVSLKQYGDSSISISDITEKDEAKYKCLINYMEISSKYAPEPTIFKLSLRSKFTISFFSCYFSTNFGISSFIFLAGNQFLHHILILN